MSETNISEIGGVSMAIYKLKNSSGLSSQYQGRLKGLTHLPRLCSFIVINIIIEKKEMLDKLMGYMDEGGKISKIFGDTYALNNYSKSFGTSNMSQAF